MFKIRCRLSWACTLDLSHEAEKLCSGLMMLLLKYYILPVVLEETILSATMRCFLWTILKPVIGSKAISTCERWNGLVICSLATLHSYRILDFNSALFVLAQNFAIRSFEMYKVNLQGDSLSKCKCVALVQLGNLR